MVMTGDRSSGRDKDSRYEMEIFYPSICSKWPFLYLKRLELH